MATISNNSSYADINYMDSAYVVQGVITLATGTISSVTPSQTVSLSGNSSTTSVGTITRNQSAVLSNNTSYYLSDWVVSDNIQQGYLTLATTSVGNTRFSFVLTSTSAQINNGSISATSRTLVLTGNVGSSAVGTEPNNHLLGLTNNSINSNVSSFGSYNSAVVAYGNQSTGSINGLVNNISISLSSVGSVGNPGTVSWNITHPISSVGSVGNPGTVSTTNSNAISSTTINSSVGSIVYTVSLSGNSTNTIINSITQSNTTSIIGNTGSSAVGTKPNNHILPIIDNSVSASANSLNSYEVTLSLTGNSVSSAVGLLNVISTNIVSGFFAYSNTKSVTIFHDNATTGNTGSSAVGTEPTNHILSIFGNDASVDVGNTIFNYIAYATSVTSIGTINNVQISHDNSALSVYSTSNIGSIIPNNTLSLLGIQSTALPGKLNFHLLDGVESITYVGAFENLLITVGITGNRANVVSANLYTDNILELTPKLLNGNVGSIKHSRTYDITGEVSFIDAGNTLADTVHRMYLPNRLFAQSGLIVQTRENPLYGNTGNISYGNEETDHRELLTSVTGYPNVGSINHDTSVYTPCVEEIVSGLLGNCGPNVVIGLSSVVATSDIQSLSNLTYSNIQRVESIVGVGNISTNISNLLIIINGIQNQISSGKISSDIDVVLTGNSSNGIVQQLNATIVKPANSVLSFARSGLIIQEKSNSLLGNTGTVSYGNEPTVISKNISTVSIAANVGIVSSNASHSVPSIEETAYVLTGNIESNVSVSISGTSSSSNVGSISPNNLVRTTRTESIGYTGSIPSVGIFTSQSGIQSNTIIGSVVFETVITDRTVSLSGTQSTGNVNTTGHKSQTSLSGNQTQLNINSINNVLSTKPVVGIISNGYVGKLRILQNPIRIVSVGLVRFARTNIQDIEFVETITRNIKYR